MDKTASAGTTSVDRPVGPLTLPSKPIYNMPQPIDREPIDALQHRLNLLAKYRDSEIINDSDNLRYSSYMQHMEQISSELIRRAKEPVAYEYV